jgi:hypothetical protein
MTPPTLGNLVMRFRHYLEARVRQKAPVPGGPFAATAAVVGAVHRANARLPERFSMSFSDFDQGGRDAVAHVLILAADPDSLTRLISDAVL